MSIIKMDIPGEDAWVLARLGAMMSHRLVKGSDDPLTRQSLLRFLFCIQRLPLLDTDLCVSIGADKIHVAVYSEVFELVSFTEDNHTEFRLQYFNDSNHCILWFDFLTGDDKRRAIEWTLDSLEESFKEGELLYIDDLSKDGSVDKPPLNDYMEYSLSYETP